MVKRVAQNYKHIPSKTLAACRLTTNGKYKSIHVRPLHHRTQTYGSNVLSDPFMVTMSILDRSLGHHGLEYGL